MKFYTLTDMKTAITKLMSGTITTTVVLWTNNVFAATNSSLPWDTPLENLADSLTGPIALSISLIGIVVAGGGLLFGGEINEFGRKGIMLALVVSVIVFASNLLEDMFELTGAVI